MAYAPYGTGYGNNYSEQERITERYTEQGGFGRPGPMMPHHHHDGNVGLGGWTDERRSYYGGGGVGVGVGVGVGPGYVGNPMIDPTMDPGFNPGRMVAGHRRRRRVRRHSPTRGYYSCSETDSD